MQEAGEAIVVELEIEASREDVFAAFENAAAMQKWCFGPGCSAARVRSEFREGGTFQVDMIPDGEAGAPIVNRGEYRLILPPRKIVFTWVNDRTGGTLMALELARKGAGTGVRLVCQGNTSPELRGEIEAGWRRVLSNLAGFVAGMQAS